MLSLFSKINYSADTALVASHQATALNIADSAVTWLQPRLNMWNDAAVVRDHMTFRSTFEFCADFRLHLMICLLLHIKGSQLF